MQERHDVLGKERQTEFDRANAAEVARTGMEVQLTAHQERVANLTTQLQESGVQVQVKMVPFQWHIAVVVMEGTGFCFVQLTAKLEAQMATHRQ